MITVFLVSTKRKPIKKPAVGTVVSLRISEELDGKAQIAAGKTNLKKSDVMRLALERGLEVLVKQLLETSAA